MLLRIVLIISLETSLPTKYTFFYAFHAAYSTFLDVKWQLNCLLKLLKYMVKENL